MSDTAQLNAALTGRYAIERELGAGGMATVYLARDLRHERHVALKVLRPELSAILGAQRFLAEIKTTANLQHPHILSLFDSGEADGTVFYVMPYVEGETLRDRLRREQQLPVDEAVRIAREMLDALDYAHQHGVVHRDIKPENILLHGGHAMVADFGIALAASKVDGGTRMTETGMSLGTPHYMSPEQAMGERVITGRADVYAVGAVLYEMLTGEPPFTGASAQAIFARVLTDEPRSLVLQRRTIPPHVEAAVQVALHKLPADRFASAALFAEALGRADFAPVGTRASMAASGRPGAPRRRPALVALAALPWVLAAAAGGFAVYGALSVPSPRVTRQRIVLWDEPRAMGAVSLGVAISPDGRTIVYRDTVAGQQQLLAKDDDEVVPRVLAGSTDGVSPVFSPDGQWIAFEADGKLRKIPRQGGSATTIADSVNGALPAIAWLDDGTIAFNDRPYGLRVVSENGGPTVRAMPVGQLGRGVVSLSPLPGGRGVLAGVCTQGCAEIELRALSFRSDRHVVLGEDVTKGWYTRDGDVIFARRDGGVFRAPFDLESLSFSAPPVPVLDGVRANAGGVDLALGDDGTALYVRGGHVDRLGWEALWVDRAGRATPVDSGWSFPANMGLALSPDGTRLAVTIVGDGTADIWVKHLDRGPLTRLTFRGRNQRPEWSADGRTVLYVSRPDQGTEDLRARRADGTGQEEVLLDLARGISEVRRGPDSTQWILRLAAPPSRDIVLWRRGADTATKQLVTDARGQESQPMLSPDGRWFAYMSNESGRPEVYVRPFPGVESRRWQVSTNGGREPLWSRSGKELFYRDGADDLIAVEVRPGPAFATGPVRRLFSAAQYQSGGSTVRTYDISADDTRFLFLRVLGRGVVESRPPDLVRVSNWFAQFRTSR